MANLTFSNALVNLLVSAVTGGQGTPIFYSGAGTFAAGTGNAIAGGSASATALYIYQGIPPTSFAGITDISQLAANLLITFLLPVYTSAVTDNGNIGNVSRRITIAKQPTAVTASATGTATWFLTCATWSTDLTNKSALMGTVGGTGSGADLIFSNPNIVAGNSYTSLGFNINFPYEWTV